MELPLEDVYQFNTNSYEWSAVKAPGSFNPFRTKSASFKIHEKLIIPGGYWHGY
jgi:hypothetical protein